jgi:hypothetical protein
MGCGTPRLPSIVIAALALVGLPLGRSPVLVRTVEAKINYGLIGSPTVWGTLPIGQILKLSID